ncbi:maleylpyruvate isomerase family mycothiol-dependent enzyme [Nocardia sp. BMG51109]|uniref:maleylpyruvate isomerase family mycothiol-dependent enzyme n=1 Tax=Nocardia sp. BMG51109 TaxID=1056816 RepID=UPI000464F45C|nr:maleylpyruvate isomerase family mycothiol-dependent enzyme [Nocardia sp. BMG51109]
MNSPNRTELTEALSDQWDALARLTDGLPEDRWRLPSPLPGWTVFDVLAHVVGTESMLLGEPTPEADTDLRELAHIHNGIGALNEKWIRSLRPLTGAELLERFRATADRRRAALTAMSDEAWQSPSESPVGTVPYARFMQVRLFDCWMHELDIADALGLTVDEGGPRADIAFAEMVPTIGRAVVKQAQAPDGSRITLTLTGAVPRQLHIAVNGRAELVDALDGPATAALDLPSGLFARLRGGRTTADAHLGEFTVTGDTELGGRVIRNLAFTL